MTGTTRSSEGLDLRRRKLLFRAWHRGMREMDLIMGGFADARVEALSEGELTEFELQTFFSFGRDELELIARRRGDNHKLGLALHIGFVRMSGRPLNSVRAVPAVLLRHLGSVLGIETPDLASLRALYARGRTLFDHQQQACEVLGFAWMTEHQLLWILDPASDAQGSC